MLKKPLQNYKNVKMVYLAYVDLHKYLFINILIYHFILPNFIPEQ